MELGKGVTERVEPRIVIEGEDGSARRLSRSAKTPGEDVATNRKKYEQLKNKFSKDL